MKQILLFGLLVTLSSCSRFIPTEIENGKLLGVTPIQHGRGSYQAVRPVIGSREDIFRQSRRWAAFHVPNPSQALNISDNLIGDIITTGSIPGVSATMGKIPVIVPAIDYAASIESFDNYYRVTLTNFRINGQPTPHSIELRNTGTNKKTTRQVLQYIDEEVKSLLDNLHEFIITEIKSQPVEAAR